MHHGSNRQRRVTRFLVLAALWATPVHAAGPHDAGKALSDQAAASFKDRHFLQAAELFERAYALAPDKLVRLRNAGRAYEEAGRLEYARLVFQRYLQLAPEGPDKAEVQVRVTKLDEKLKPPPVNPLPGPVPGPPAATQIGMHDVRLHKAEPPPPRVLGWTLTSSGGLALAGGIAWLLAVGRAQDRLDTDVAAHHYDYPGGDTKRTADEATVSTQRALAWTTLGVGAAALGYGVYEVLRSEPVPVAVQPWIQPGQAGVLVTARF
jgi:tetratricopeptide (TPR) repeat protein